MEILKSIAPRKEGTWDSVAVAQMGEGIIMMKETQAAQGSKSSPERGATKLKKVRVGRVRETCHYEVCASILQSLH